MLETAERAPAEKENDGMIFWATNVFTLENCDINAEGSILAADKRATPEILGDTHGPKKAIYGRFGLSRSL